MKRRYVDCGKLRRQIKRNKITENMNVSPTVLYMKFLVLWAIVITADFMFMFRFEFLWPFWLLLRSVHDSFKYKGLVFSVLFVCIAITSDLVCFFYIPVHWLLFAASTYVWVQYVWHTDKGICLPTIILWMLFVYLEAGIRWKDSRHTPHIGLCRPFAAHCIGYPVVTLGFGFKSYVDYRLQQSNQRVIAKKNEIYMDLLQEALYPKDPIVTVTTAVACSEDSPSSQAMSMQISPTMVTTATSAVMTTNPYHSCTQNSAQLSNFNILTMTTANSDGSAEIMSNGTSSTSPMTTNIYHSNHNNHQQQQPLSNTSHQNYNGSNNLPNGANYHNNNQSSTNISTTSFNHGIPTASIATSTSTITTPSSTANPLFILLSPSATASYDDKHYEALNINSLNSGGSSNSACGSNIGGGATPNGHIGVNSHSKMQRRSTDKDHKNRNGSTSSSSANETECKRKNKNNLQMDGNCNHNNSNGKDKSLVVNNSLEEAPNPKDKQEHQRDRARKSNNNSNPKTNNIEIQEEPVVAIEPVEHNNSGEVPNPKDKQEHQRDRVRKSNNNSNPKTNNNETHRIPQYEEPVVAIDAVERTKGRRNRPKKDNAACKDNQQQQQQHNANNNSNNHNSTTQSNHNSIKENGSSQAPTTTINNFRLHNSDASSVSSISSSSTTSSTSLTSSATSALANIASKVVSKICESCLKFEADIKKYRSEISHMKQIENELRQKLDSNLTTKSCLQAKQKECDELEKRILELTNARQADLKVSERRLTEERRQKQSLEAKLNNERKARKIAEDKAARPECSLQCKQRKQQMEDELKQLRQDLKSTKDAKLLAEQHGRKWEQESRKFEAEIRSRDTNQQPTEMLMNALAAMQDKNCTLEKNLSAETRVKLDLFSALGAAKRQLEISESRRRSKEEEVLDLKAKIARLLSVMHTDTLCMPACGSTSANTMLRMNESPPVKNLTGPASPLLITLVNAQASAERVVQQQPQVPTSTGDYAQQAPDYCSGLVPVSVANSVLTVSGSNGGPVAGASNLDPNASVYTPKTLQPGPGGVVVSGGNVPNGEA